VAPSRKTYKPLLLLLCLAAGLLIFNQWRLRAPLVELSAEPGELRSADTAPLASDLRLAQVFAQHQSYIWLAGEGRVTRLLPDDNSGSRHQKFLLRLENGRSLLIVHNIDLAPAIDDLAVGDTVDFYGEYIWNAKGGLIHWTHRDPDGRREGGWIRHKGRLYR